MLRFLFKFKGRFIDDKRDLIGVAQLLSDSVPKEYLLLRNKESLREKIWNYFL